MSCLDCFTVVSSRKLSGWQLVPSPCRLERSSTPRPAVHPQQCGASLWGHLVALGAGWLCPSDVVLLELRLCWPLCLWEVRGGQSLAQNTKGELGGTSVKGWMALKCLWAKGLLTSGDPALGTGLGEACLSHVRPSGAGFAPGCTSGMQNQTFPLLSQPGHL